MPGPDLFSEATDRLVAARAPLAARMRPRTLDDVVGQSHLTDPGSALRRLIESDRVSSVILWGPPGTGKTTIAELIASGTRRVFERLSAVTAGVKDVREVIEAARNRTMIDGTATVVFIDEIHRF
ncbi:MAG: AAA family ATPase, partial [Actinomycetota bacterium]